MSASQKSLANEDPEAIEALWAYSQEVQKQAVEHFERLDDKIQSYFSFGGVVVSLLLASSETVIKAADKSDRWSLIPATFFFAAIVAMAIGILFALRAYFLRSLEGLPLPEKIVEWYTSKDCLDKSRARLLKACIIKSSKSAESFNRMASEKAIQLKHAGRCFIIGLISLVIFMTSFGVWHFARVWHVVAWRGILP